MKSPFPGMDPWLEQHWLWPDVHGSLLVIYRRALVPQVVEKYSVALEFRTTRVNADDPAFKYAIPDLLVVREPARAYNSARGVSRPTSVLTVAEWAEFREPLLVIRDRQGNEIVTWIELLSPTNKMADSTDRAKYLQKRARTMRTNANLVEIDLLRGGERLPFFEDLPEGDYFAYVSRAQKRPETEIWATKLARQLPVIPIPLCPPDTDARLDLQEALRVAYEEARYDKRVRYDESPDKALTRSQMKWAKKRIADWKRERNGKR